MGVLTSKERLPPSKGGLIARNASVTVGLGLGLAVVGGVAAPAAADGAYYPTAWGWTALVFGWTAVLALLVRRRIRLTWLQLGAVAALGLLCTWIALSTVWSADVTQSVLEVERALVYLTAFLALVLVARRGDASFTIGGILAGITGVAAYALATRLVPERLGHPDALAGNRLFEPLGYWNAVGCFAAMGSLLALGVAAHARSQSLRVPAAAALPILLPALYFTFSRGAWIALGLALIVTLAVDPRRLELATALLVVSPFSIVAVLLASRMGALTRKAASLTEASHDGHRLALVVLGLAVASAGAALAVHHVERHLPALPRARLAYGVAVWLAALLGFAAIFVVFGSPWHIAQKGYKEFKTPPVVVAPGQSLNRRLLSFSGNGRLDQWRIAWHEYEAHPWLGSGAGTFELYWMRDRPQPSKVRDAHGLYVETLAELGPVGLGLLVVALGLPLVAAVRARRTPLVAGVFGAYVVYLAHAGVDWDWEMPAVTLTALFLAALLLSIESEGSSRQRTLPSRLHGAALLAVLAAVAFAFVGLVSNTALSESGTALEGERFDQAKARAHRAIRWAPWSSDGWEALGQAQLEQGELSAARSSFRKAISKDPRDWNLWLDLALSSSGKQRKVAALVAYRLSPRSLEIAQARRLLGLPAPPR
jgi:tetratricopeptide (TPR) repeat protein